MQSSAKGPTVSTYVARRTTKGPGFYITFLIFFVAVLVSIGMFVYTKIIEASIDDKIAQIERVQAAFDPAVMKELIRVDTRMTHANQLVQNHVVPSQFLALLEQTTLRNLRFRSLSFTTDPTTGTPAASQLLAAPSIQLQGQAPDFKQIALQADQFGANPDIRNPVVSGLNIDTENLATFGVSMNIDPRIISYTDALRSGRRAATPVTRATPPAPKPVTSQVGSSTTTATTTATTSTTANTNTP